VGPVDLTGLLAVPEDAIGVVLSQSSRIARVLHEAHIATLVFDLLTPREEALDFVTREHRFDVRVLAQRLVEITDWLGDQRGFERATIGYLGTSTGSAAALVAAADLGRHVAAVVCWAGRPDLAGEALTRVEAPTLLVVGGYDRTLIGLNELACARLAVTKEIAIVAGASHLFEEPGTLERVGALASRWFEHHLAAAPATT